MECVCVRVKDRNREKERKKSKKKKKEKMKRGSKTDDNSCESLKNFVRRTTLFKSISEREIRQEFSCIVYRLISTLIYACFLVVVVVVTVLVRMNINTVSERLASFRFTRFTFCRSVFRTCTFASVWFYFDRFYGTPRYKFSPSTTYPPSSLYIQAGK